MLANIKIRWLVQFKFSILCLSKCLFKGPGDSHAVALGSSEVSSVARGREVSVLMGLRALLAPSHLALVEGVACRDSVLVRRHRHPDLTFLEEGTAHCLLSLLSGGRGVDHLLRLKKELVDSVLALDGCPAAHAVDVVGVHRHLLGVDELVDHWLAVGLLGVGHEASVVRPLGVVTHRHLLSRGSVGELGLDLAATGLALRPTSNGHGVGVGHACDLSSRVFTGSSAGELLLLLLLLVLLLLLDIVVMSSIAVELRSAGASVLVE